MKEEKHRRRGRKKAVEKSKTCCFTGHRPNKLPWGDNENAPECLALKASIARKVEEAIPCESQANRWSRVDRERYARLVGLCDFETMVQHHYDRGCMLRRNRYMVDRSSLLIAAFDGSKGGTLYTITYAMKKGIEVEIIDV